MKTKKIVTDFFQINIIDRKDYTFQIFDNNVIDREEYESDSDVWFLYDAYTKTECLLEHISIEFSNKHDIEDIEELLESLVEQVEEAFTKEEE
ncbi:hypothetical protein [Nostoc phage YongM]|nr:hypothetical protein [Nostoc phage YongM]